MRCLLNWISGLMSDIRLFTRYHAKYLAVYRTSSQMSGRSDKQLYIPPVTRYKKAENLVSPDIRSGRIFCNFGFLVRTDIWPGRLFGKAGYLIRPDIWSGRISCQAC